jgi:uncharacterized protein YjdB
MLLRAAFNNTTKVVNVDLNGVAIPGGSTAIGTFEHPDIEYPDSVVVYHAVRELLYKRKQSNPAQAGTFPDNITDMAGISIQTTLKFPVVPLTGLDSTAPAGNLAVAGTKQITNVFTPANATDKRVTYASSNTGRATVSATGLVTGVAAGAVTITVTANGATDTVAITVA